MELGWGALALIIVGAAMAWFWQDSLAARERANAAAMRACLDMGLQFLDGTVAFARIALSRSAGGRMTLRRTYVFDYTVNSIERRQGFIVMNALRIESIGYAPGTTPPRPAIKEVAPPIEHPPTEQDAAHTSDGDSRVLRLDDWRARRRRANGSQPQWREDRDDRIK
jgi:hypothetical protein